MTRRSKALLCAVGCLAFGLGTLLASGAASGAGQEIWRFDNTATIGGHPAKLVGAPRIIHSELGNAIAFNGASDALLVGVHPLAGAKTWTWEMIFKPDADGNPAQRIFHLQSVDAAGGQDVPAERMLFEIRIVNGQWCLDSFATGGGQGRTLLNCAKLHPFGQWYRVTAVYDGKMLHNYVGDELQDEGDLTVPPAPPGHASVGARIDLRDWYKGAIYEARFTRRALAVKDFLKLPVPK